MAQPGDDIVREFLVESHENLDQLDRDFVSLEKDPGAQELLSRAFRTIHTIKGTCGFLGFHRLEAVTHAGEGVLSLLRDGTLKLDAAVTGALLAMVDAVREILGRIESAGAEGDESYRPVIGNLERIQSSVPSKPVDPRALSDFAPAIPAANTSLIPAAITPPAPATSTPPAAVRAELPAPLALEAETPPGHEEGPGTSVADGNVRVDVGLLDRLVALVSELVLARNQILQMVGRRDYTALPAAAQRIDLVTTELQESVLKTRMQPIGNLWNKLPRLVRDVSASCGKDVRIEMQGRETELDKTVLEAIRDPLTHLVRNAISHGIENPGIRAACRKPAQGRVMLRAFHEGGHVFIEVSDDGAGLPLERIRLKAIERKLVPPERAAALSDRDWAKFIFTPGFSTAQTVTAISGRGVGMDVVKTNIERIGGSVDVQTQGAVGTTVFLKIPLTLAIVPALIVTDDGERFAIPQVSLQELFRIDAAHVRGAVEWVHEAPVFRLRDRLLPLVFLRELLHERRPFSSSSLAARDGLALNVVVLNGENRTFGLVVDMIDDAEEIVVKPLSDPLKEITVLAGATILGDGRVGLILDVAGLARGAGLTAGGERAIPLAAAVAIVTPAHDPLLVVEVRPGWRVGLPLSRVARLEDFPTTRLERNGDREVVQHLGDILPLERLSRLLNAPPPESAWGSSIPAVVLEHGGRRFALGVAGILDIVDEPFERRPVAGRPGISGAAVIGGRVVDLLDLDGICGRLAREWRDAAEMRGA